MHRRRFFAAVAGGPVTGLAGCANLSGDASVRPGDRSDIRPVVVDRLERPDGETVVSGHENAVS